MNQRYTPQPQQELTADSTMSPEQRRRKPRQANEFFVMMFRNYPILAKGVSVCVGCQLQMTSNTEVDNHINSACCTGPDGRPADVKRSTIFKCTHCEKTFWKAKSCRQHQIDTCLPGNGIDLDSLVQPSVGCPLCAAKSYNRSGLMSHMKYKHGMDTKGVRDIMDQYGIHKQTADLVQSPLKSSANTAVRLDSTQNSPVDKINSCQGALTCIVSPASNGAVPGAGNSASVKSEGQLMVEAGHSTTHVPVNENGELCRASYNSSFVLFADDRDRSTLLNGSFSSVS